MAKGKKVVHFALPAERPSDEELLSLMLGRSGKLRAPVVRTGDRLIVGYNADLYADTLL